MFQVVHVFKGTKCKENVSIACRIQNYSMELMESRSACSYPVPKCWVLNPDVIFSGNLGRLEVKMRRMAVHKYVVVRKPDFTSAQENTEFCGQGGLCKTSLIIFGTRLCRIRNGI